MLGHLRDLVHPGLEAGARLAAEVIPGLDPRQHGLEAGSAQPPEIRLREQRQAALGSESDAARRYGLLDGGHVVVEAHAEVRVVPADTRIGHHLGDEAQVVTDLLELERLVGNLGVDAEAAGIGAPDAADHRDHLEARRHATKRRLDVLPALPNARKLARLRFCSQVDAHRSVGLTVGEDLADDLAVGESDDVVEIAACVFRIAACVWSPEDGHHPTAAEEIADGVGKLCRLRERTDEQQIDVFGELLDQILCPRVAHQLDVVAGFLAPNGDDLRHDAREVGVHHPSPEGLGWCSRHQIQHADSQSPQIHRPVGATFSSGCATVQTESYATGGRAPRCFLRLLSKYADPMALRH